MLFITNKYYNIYFDIISRARHRKISGYSEKHHIIPKSLGGTDTKDNLVVLTPREHLVCHLLLTKIVCDEHKGKMIYALQCMTMKSRTTKNRYTKINSRIYASVKKEISRLASERMANRTYEEQMGLESATRKRESISRANTKEKNPFWGKKHSAETRRFISENQTGEKSHKFKGYYVTPWGKFASTREAARNCPVKVSSENVRKNCTERNKKIISRKSIYQNNYLREEHLGKTYAEIGYGFAKFSLDKSPLIS